MWKELVKIAILGTERAQIPEEIRHNLKAWGLHPDPGDEKNFLSWVASYSAYQRSFAVEPVNEVYFLQGPEPEDPSRTYCSEDAINSLTAILNGKFEHALPEFLDLLQRKNYLIPPHLLPDLLYLACQSPDIWQAIELHVGNTGKWLITLNADWHLLGYVPEHFDWNTSSFAERLRYFELLRQQNPAKAREVLESTWSTEGWRNKLAFLKAMEKTITPGDEPFLIQCAEESRKELRLAAINLQGKLPHGKLVETYRELVLQCIQNTGIKYELKWPDDASFGLPAGSFQPNVRLDKTGLQKSILRDLIGRVPPSGWLGKLGRSPEEILSKMSRSQGSAIMIGGVMEAFVRFPDMNWASGLIRIWLKLEEEGNQADVELEPVVEKIPADLYHEIALDLLARQAGLIPENSSIARFLKSGNQAWSEKLWWAVFGPFQKSIQQMETMRWDLWHYRELLHKAAYRVPPVVLEQSKVGWEIQNHPGWQMWGKDIEALIAILQFRKKLREALG